MRFRIPDQSLFPLFILASLSLASPACSMLDRHESFATPEDTLMTFQSAYQRGDSALEYKCFSYDFQRRGIGGLQSYDAFRQRAIDENPSIDFVLNNNDLSDNIEAVRRLDESAELEARVIVSIYGRRVEFEFVNERIVRVKFADAKPIEDYLKRAPEIRKIDGYLLVPLESLYEQLSDEQLREVRGWEIVPNWKFKSLAPRPLVIEE